VTTEDGVACLLDLYRPVGSGAVDVILLPDLRGERASWAAAAETLASRGCVVGCLGLRPLRPEGSRPVWGRMEDPLAPWTEAWREVAAARDRLREEGDAAGAPRPFILAGAGTGAAVAAVAASRLPQPPQALVLLQPQAALAGIPITPILAGLDIPVLLVCPVDASEARETASDAYLACRPRSTLWMTGGIQDGAERLLARRPQLAVDLATWLIGKSAGPGSERDGEPRVDPAGATSR
jgi:alpha-beta hydrolase superfamily lysophospholipase